MWAKRTMKSDYASLITRKHRTYESIKVYCEKALREKWASETGTDTPETNIIHAAKSTKEALERFRAAKAASESIRGIKTSPMGVLAIEYKITASSRVMGRMHELAQARYLQASLDWVSGRHGNDRILVAVTHRDMATPSLSVLVDPRDKTGEFNADIYVGSHQAVNEMQMDFAHSVAEKFGLNEDIKQIVATSETIYRLLGSTGTRPR